MQCFSRPRALARPAASRGSFDFRTVLAVLGAATATLLAVPIAYAAADGGPAAADPPAQQTIAAPQIDGRLSAAISTHHGAIRARGLVSHPAGRRVRVTLRARRAGRRAWFTVAAAKVVAGEKFTLTWHASRPGRYLTKLTELSDGRQASDHLGAALVFRASFASYYGPGFYGGGLACGGRLTPTTVGVAHKTLPCGTKVTFKVGRHIVTAPVIDRGPYVSGRDWDLTAALKRKLHFGSTGVVHTTS